MPTPDPNISTHLEWLGFIQPEGLVVSATALVKQGAILQRHDAKSQARLESCIEQRPIRPGRGPQPCLPDFQSFTTTVLGWRFSTRGYAGTEENPIPGDLQEHLPDYGVTLAPSFAIREREPAEGASGWQLLVQTIEPGEDFDKSTTTTGWQATPRERIERLLRSKRVHAGLLFNGVAIRLISAPYGESSGWMDFRVADMLQTAGRPLCAALRLLLSEQRLLALPKDQRLAALLANSRKYQNEVSERLAEQVLHALYDLLRGFQAAHDASRGELLREPLAADGDRNDIYRGLLTVILRLVFLLYAEERGMLPVDGVFQRHYSLASLYKRLREDAALNPDTMDQRYGAWAQLLVLFRLIHDGAPAYATGGAISLPQRRGALFNPDRFKFLEGRSSGSGARQINQRITTPLVSDGAIHRVLEKLLVLDGERISYRSLDVEQIGSVYETIMGFRLEIASGRSIAIKAAKKHGPPSTIDLDKLLETPGGSRVRWVQDHAHRRPTESVAKGLRTAMTINDLHTALDRILDKNATPDLAPKGALVLQPNEERRRSGSHYTPRELTEPIVRHTLEPILERLCSVDGQTPKPEAILDLKICDPAMGSGAFLVEACRQLADALIDSWGAHAATPQIPPDEDAVIHARRLIAKRCLYGVDKNPMAVDLAKVSLWLSTLSQDHPLTFVDHAIRHGDSLAGLTRRQIEALHWQGVHPILQGFGVREALDQASALRRQIREADDTVTERELQDLWREARDALADVRLFGDLVLSAFFEGSNKKEREQRRVAYQAEILNQEAGRHAMELEERRNEEAPFAPFHWEIEFPEVFERENPGFDAFVGNPPFAGKNSIAAGNAGGYPDWLKAAHEESHGNADLVAHFYRRAFNLVREGGAFGLIATNTIAQGDTRSSGLRWICQHGGEIYRAAKRLKWPGDAAVVVSVLHLAKGKFSGDKFLDGAPVDNITAFLFHDGVHDDPERLEANAGQSFQGSIVLGMGFTFDDTDRKGVATPLAKMERLIEETPRNGEAIFPYIGGEEINTSPTHAHHRYVINFRDWPLRRSDLWGTWKDADDIQRREWRRNGIAPLDYPDPVAADWPELLKIVEDRAKPQRDALPPKNSINREATKKWWRFLAYRQGLHGAIHGLDRVLVINCGATPHHAFTFLPTPMVYANTLAVLAFDNHAAFCALQSRPHETWARFFGSSMKDDLRYTPSDCFETFPFPEGWETLPALEASGTAYYDFRASLMIQNNEGMTKTCNRFHDPYENDPRIAELRYLHAAMDRALLDAYGWTDIPTDCDFLLDYKIDEATWGKKRRPVRYRWPDPVRDEVLARLLALNAERAAEEARVAAASGAILKIPKPAPTRYRRSEDSHSIGKVAETKSLWDTTDD